MHGQYPKPVPYTHLDVYKRQSHYSLKYLLEEFEPINALAKMDKVLLAKKATASQLENACSEDVKFGESKYAVTVPPPADSVIE